MSGNPNITIDWDSGTSTLQASPSPFYAGNPGQGRVVTWGPGSNVGSLATVVITKKDGQTYDGTQPSSPGTGSNQWQWNDPETATDTYEYVVSANVNGVGVRTLDPQIINRSGG